MKLGIKILSLLFLLALVFASCTKLEEIKPDDKLEQVFSRGSGEELDDHDGDSSSDDDDDSFDDDETDTINDDDDDEDDDDNEDGAERDTE